MLQALLHPNAFQVCFEDLDLDAYGILTQVRVTYNWGGGCHVTDQDPGAPQWAGMAEPVCHNPPTQCVDAKYTWVEKANSANT